MQIKDLKTLEQSFDFSSVKFEGQSIWPVLRIYYFFKMRDLQVSNNVTNSQVFVKRVTQRLRSLPRGLGHFLKSLVSFRDGYICFSDSYELRIIDNVVQNKLFFRLFKKLGAVNILYFEKPVEQKFFSHPPSNPKAISTSVLDMLAMVGSFFVGSVKIENEKVLKDAEKALGFELDYLKLLKILRAYRVVTYYLFKLFRPKAVFMSDYYNMFHMAICHSAGTLGIPVVEFQHGVINKEHPAYNFYAGRVKTNYLPAYFSAFGQKFIDSLGEKSYISPENMIIGGHSYLSFLKTESNSVSVPARYKTSATKILVTLQWTDEKQVIDFILKLAGRSEFTDTLFILLPRQWNESLHASYKLPANVVFELEYDFYAMMKMVDIHVTTYSTTALEAPFFGLPNIMLNFDQMAQKYFNAFIKASSYDYYVETEEEFVNSFKSIKSADPIKSELSLQRNVIESECLDTVLDLIKINNSEHRS